MTSLPGGNLQPRVQTFPGCVLPQSFGVEEILLDLVCIMFFLLQDVVDRSRVAADSRGKHIDTHVLMNSSSWLSRSAYQSLINRDWGGRRSSRNSDQSITSHAIATHKAHSNIVGVVK